MKSAQAAEPRGVTVALAALTTITKIGVGRLSNRDRSLCSVPVINGSYTGIGFAGGRRCDWVSHITALGLFRSARDSSRLEGLGLILKTLPAVMAAVYEAIRSSGDWLGCCGRSAGIEA